MTISPSDSFTSTPIPVSPIAVPPVDSRAQAAARRREAALARLAARRMPLPGLPATPPPPVPAASRTATTQHTAVTSRRPHIRLIPAADTTPPPPAPAPAVAPVAAPVAVSSSTELRPRPGLTQREIQVLTTWLLTDSKISVAQELCISIGTVNTHLTRIRAKYTAVDRTARTKAALAARAIQDGILSLDDL
ncbi:helix-turn-helix transcriptional regulator [Gordonia insulae]|uniref:HTH luxR-type domain-containing protein n=1 Tax=Gordonia insulae TaxID=2420509 RepID=A0A3G8JF36_9ACTN|nr:LuxR C-terminal-related transcriptional regulator [Gordonia insulae]AZG43756.1 hypothetical protein D7316_00325 [Gordonia insulae]